MIALSCCASTVNVPQVGIKMAGEARLDFWLETIVVTMTPPIVPDNVLYFIVAANKPRATWSSAVASRRVVPIFSFIHRVRPPGIVIVIKYHHLVWKKASCFAQLKMSAMLCCHYSS